MRRTAADFKRETVDEPYEVELESGTVVVMRTSRDAPISLTDRIASWTPEDGEPRPLQMQVEFMVGPDHFDEFWAEYREHPWYVLQDLIEECDEHYADGLGEGKGVRSIGSSTATATRSKRTSKSASG